MCMSPYQRAGVGPHIWMNKTPLDLCGPVENINILHVLLRSDHSFDVVCEGFHVNGCVHAKITWKCTISERWNAFIAL